MRAVIFIVAMLGMVGLALAACGDSVTEPDVPTYTSLATDGNYLTFAVTYDTDYDEEFTVAFGGNGDCDFTSVQQDGGSNAGVWTVDDTNSANCERTITFNKTTASVFADCGYAQDNARGDGKTHYVNTINFQTMQNRTDLRSPYNATRDFPFTSDISIATTVTATVENLQVFGSIFTLNLLGSLAVDIIEITPGVYTYQITGVAVTSSQYPYRLEYNDDTGSANNQHSSLIGTGITATPDTFCDTNAINASCTQEWTFSYNISNACGTGGPTNLTDEWVYLEFAVNCSNQFDGECATTFSEEPAINVTLATADFCPQTSTVSLSGGAEVYAYQPAGSNDQTTADSTWLEGAFDAYAGNDAWTSPVNDFVVEDIFVYESKVYGEAVVEVANSAATIDTANITEIRTIPSTGGYQTFRIYQANNDGSGEVVTHSSVVVNNGNTNSFGVAADYDNDKSRFLFIWNNDTLDRNNNESIEADAAQPATIEIDLIVSFAEGASFNPVIAQFSKDTGAKEAFNTIVFTDEPFSARTTVGIADIAPTTTTPTTPAATSSSSGLFSSTAFQAAAVAVAGVAVIALVAIVVLRRGDDEPKPSSSNLNHTGESQVELMPTQVALEDVQQSYSDN